MSKIIPAILSPVIGLSMLLKKKPKAPQVQAAPSRDDFEERDGVLQRLKRRRGSGANELLGASGAEATTGPAPAAMGV